MVGLCQIERQFICGHRNILVSDVSEEKSFMVLLVSVGQSFLKTIFKNHLKI